MVKELTLFLSLSPLSLSFSDWHWIKKLTMWTQIYVTHNKMWFYGDSVRANKGKHIRLVDNVVVCVKLIRSKCSLYFCGLCMCTLMCTFLFFFFMSFFSLLLLLLSKFRVLLLYKIIYYVSNYHVLFFVWIYH